MSNHCFLGLYFWFLVIEPLDLGLDYVMPWWLNNHNFCLIFLRPFYKVKTSISIGSQVSSNDKLLVVYCQVNAVLSILHSVIHSTNVLSSASVVQALGVKIGPWSQYCQSLSVTG
jgi:hypothetical protein